jgi:hypothetical protein
MAKVKAEKANKIERTKKSTKKVNVKRLIKTQQREWTKLGVQIIKLAGFNALHDLKPKFDAILEDAEAGGAKGVKALSKAYLKRQAEDARVQPLIDAAKEEIEAKTSKKQSKQIEKKITKSAKKATKKALKKEKKRSKKD